jgi:hypothetical protein
MVSITSVERAANEQTLESEEKRGEIAKKARGLLHGSYTVVSMSDTRSIIMPCPTLRKIG